MADDSKADVSKTNNICSVQDLAYKLEIYTLQKNTI
jgi:hypothetical protein